MAADDLIQIGKIIGAHGIRGAVKVYSYAESVDRFTGENGVTLVDRKGVRTQAAVREAKTHKNIVRLTLADVTTRNHAEAMVGWGVFIPKSDLPELASDTYYWKDLIGIAVYTDGDELLGSVEQIIPTGANDVYVVRATAEQPVREILIPAIASVVIDIDVAKGRMTVVLPEGLM